MKKILLSLLVVSSCFALDQDAVNLYNKYLKPNYSNKDSINENVVKPSINASNFKTLDKSKTFSAPLSCPSQEKAIVISFSQISGDFTAYIKIDTNLDGTFDYFYTTPNISGVCTNGIVSCQPGTWQNCKYYYWIAEDRKPRLIETMDTSKTGPCACSNISCGITTLDQPLFSQIGGGIAQAISKEDSRFVVSKSQWIGNTLELYGQDSKNCTDYNVSSINSYGETNPTTYYNAQVPPSVSIADVTTKQSNDPYSPYSIVSQTQNYEYEDGKQIGTPSFRECVIRNVVYSETKVFQENCSDIYTDNNGEKWCVDKRNYLFRTWGACRDCAPLIQSLSHQIEVKYNQKWAVVLRIANLVGDRGRYWIRKISNDGIYVVNDTYTGLVFSVVELFRVLGTSNKKLEIHNIYAYQNAYAWGKNHSYPPGWGEILVLKSLFYTDDEFKISNTNTCPSDCKLVDEWVCDKDGNNCIQTVKNGNPLAVSLKKQCYEYSTSISKYLICSDGNNITISNAYNETKTIGSGWFYIKRKYNCGTQNLEVDISRFKNVVESSQIDSSGKKVSYTDLGQSEIVDLSNISSESCLTPICTVKVPKTDTAVFTDDKNRADTPAGTNSFELEVRTCNKDGSIMTCPLNSGEQLVEDCKCDIGEQRAGFQTAITSLQILKEASKDMICSSSPP